MKKANFSEKQLLSRKELKKVLGGDLGGIIDADCPEGRYKYYCVGGFIGEDGIYHNINIPMCADYGRPAVCGDGSGGGGVGGTDPGTTT